VTAVITYSGLTLAALSLCCLQVGLVVVTGYRWQQEMAAVSRGGRYDSFGTAVTILVETFPYVAFRQ